MLKAEQIPEAVWRVAMMTYHREIRRNPEQAWQLAIAAALNAWPGVLVSGPHSSGHGPLQTQLVLPLPQETDNG